MQPSQTGELDAGFVAQFHFTTSIRVVCPICLPERRKQNIKDMTLTRQADGAVLFCCHHCGAEGSIQPEAAPSSPRPQSPRLNNHKESMEMKLSAVPQAATAQRPLGATHYAYLSSRGISKATADKARLFAAVKFFPKSGVSAEAIGFPYFREGALVAAKYRRFPDKEFTQDVGGAHDLFGIDLVTKGKPLVIVEGEMDQLSMMEAGIENVVSVPGGAPMKVADGKVSASEDKRFAFIWNAREIIEAAPYVVIATDQDGPGQALAEEIARRIGKEKCRLAKFDNKDANEALMDGDPARNGVEKVRDIVDQAQPYPISGLSDANSFSDKIHDLFTKGTGTGHSTGYSSLDTLYTIAPAQMTVVTGYPSSGKSNVVDQLMVNLAKGADWKFAIWSPENQPEIHIVRLMEIYSRKRFYEGQYRMTQDERDAAFKWVNDHFVFIDSGGDEPDTIESILARAKAAILRMGIRGLVIDPYNYIVMDNAANETKAISDMLTKVRKFCLSTDVHTWFVAHPAKVSNRSGTELPRPDGMSIAGSMAWWAKADCGLTVHRVEGHVEVASWKCRYRWVGSVGETSMLYDKVAGTYRENLDRF